jgi:hypothetical protein
VKRSLSTGGAAGAAAGFRADAAGAAFTACGFDGDDLPATFFAAGLAGFFAAGFAAVFAAGFFAAFLAVLAMIYPLPGPRYKTPGTDYSGEIQRKKT